MYMMIMKKAIPKAFTSSISEKIITTKRFLTDIKNGFVKNKKVEICTLLKSLISMSLTGKCNIKEYIMEMSYLTSKLKALKLEFFEDLLVYLFFITLPT